MIWRAATWPRQTAIQPQSGNLLSILDTAMLRALAAPTLGTVTAGPTESAHGRRRRSVARLPSTLVGLLALLLAIPDRGPAQPVTEDHAERMAQGLELFRSRVGPLFAQKCLACHGGGQVNGGVDLTSRGSLVASGKVGASAADSRLVAVLRHESEPFMPLGQARLEDSEIEAIARWIELGAPYDQPLGGREEQTSDSRTGEEFWSFRPLADPVPPTVRDEAWVRTPIDRFILARLEAAGIGPNSPGARRTLIRRASLDLLGLPPSPEHVEEFAQSAVPGAYERLVDELIESPHFGERWARHWMDIARFAESYGFEEDYDRPYAFHYRDFLIKAFNRDMPYDRFVRLQVAGDELEPENAFALMATAFMGSGPFPTEITEAEFETTRYDELDDMIGTLGTAMLGLTVGCARCHDHKHDPISAGDYYRLAAIFGRTTRTEIEYDLNPAKFRKERAEWEARLAKLRATREETIGRLDDEGYQEWLAAGAPGAGQDDWRVLDVNGIESKSLAKNDKLDDGSILFTGDNVDFDRYRLVAEVKASDIRSLRVEALTHPALPSGGPGRAHDGKFLLGLVSVKATPLADPDAEPVKLRFSDARATDQLDSDYYSAAAAIYDDSDRSGWAVPPSALGSDHVAIFDFEEPVGFDGGSRWEIELGFRHNSHFSLGRIRLSVTSSPEAPFAVRRGVREGVAHALQLVRANGPDALTEVDRRALLGEFARRSEEWTEATATIRDHESRVPISASTKIMATAEGFSKPRHNATGMGYPHFYEQTHVLRRGDASLKLEPAVPRVLPLLDRSGDNPAPWRASPPPGWNRSRLDRASLARWLTNHESGAGALLARVIVNRIWHHHFGTGIVATPSNFGKMGARPTHPDLLEWLARDLVRNGWRLKRLHRMIMNSSVYRVSASSDTAKRAADPGNRLRWRWTPRRLEAEAIRDSMLVVSGMLDRRMFGPGAQDERMSRRSIYFFIKRSELIPSMMLFDWPEHLVGIGRRPTTTIAPQALLFLNSPFARRYAEGFSRRLSGLDSHTAINAAYRTALAREPRAEERSRGLAFLEHQVELYGKDGRSDPEHRALVDYCQSLMGLNEFLYIR